MQFSFGGGSFMKYKLTNSENNVILHDKIGHLFDKNN
jgi:hypothetical protein